MSQSEFERKVMPMVGIIFIVLAMIAFAIYLTASSNVAAIALLGVLFLMIGIGFLGAWAWKRSASKIGADDQRIMR